MMTLGTYVVGRGGGQDAAEYFSLDKCFNKLDSYLDFHVVGAVTASPASNVQ